ncbi:MAG: DNA internalization-related competence protein ComEC/Rec2 [Gammaproteobacteria bacterium]|nr:DNA internalization-related competence protein ComEC/Rec2 [Gammaproteobacteria bacterium]
MTLPLVSLSFLAGTCLLYSLPQTPSLSLLLICLIIAWRNFFRNKSRVAAIVLFALAGLFWSALANDARLAQRLHPDKNRLEIEIEARIVSVVRQTDSGLAFRVSALTDNDGPAKLLELRWYDYPSTAQRPLPGERWLLLTRLRAPRGLANPGARWQEDYALRHGVAGRGYILSGKKLPAKKSGAQLNRIRDRLSHAVAASLPDSPGMPLLVALAVGDRQHLREQHWDVLRKTGLSHVISISGMHIAIVAGLAYLLGRLLGVLSGGPIVAACLLSAVMASAYAALAGFTIPTQRALIVVFVFLASRLGRRRSGSTHALSLALLLVVLRDPWCPLDFGFWLSFGAVVVIVYVSAGRTVSNSWYETLRIQMAIIIGLGPLLLLFFGQLSLSAPLVNFLLLPLFTLLLVPGTLLGVLVWFVWPDVGIEIFRLVAFVLDFLWPQLVWIAGIPALSYQSAAPSAVTFALAVVAVAWCLSPPGWPARRLGWLCLLPVFLQHPTAPSHGSFFLQTLDVGQGLAVVVGTRNYWLVFDTGPAWRNGGDAGARIVVPYLQRLGVRRIDRLIVSHGDNDHAGGMAAILKHFAVDSVFASHIDGQPLCQRGDKWFWDGVVFEILHPPVDGHASGNNASCVLRISNGHACALLTGDIEAAAEYFLVARDAENIRCELVWAAHHGSATSSTQQFVTAAEPRVVVVSSGYGNPWGFPRPAVVRRWQRAGAILLNTASSGAINAAVDASGRLSLGTQRCRQKRFWRDSRHCSVVADFQITLRADDL